MNKLYTSTLLDIIDCVSIETLYSVTLELTRGTLGSVTYEILSVTMETDKLL